MKQEITIGPPSLSTEDSEARLTVTLSQNGRSLPYWYAIPKEYNEWFSLDRCDGFVVGILLQAMRCGADINVNGPMSSRLWHSLSSFYIPLLAQTYNLHRTLITPKSLVSARLNPPAVGTGFSAGIDSFAAIVQHFAQETSPDHRISHFLFHNVGSHGHGTPDRNRTLFLQRLQIVKPCAAELGIALIPVDSNIAELFPVDFVRMHHCLNASVLLLLQNQFQRYYYASAHRYADCSTQFTDGLGRLDPFGFHLLSTENLDCVSTGGQMSRVEKTRLVAGYEPSHRYLNVCVDARAEGHNCSCCWKCCRTMLTLEILGLSQLYKRVFDFEKFRSVRASYLRNVLRHRGGSFETEIAELLMQSGKGLWPAMLRTRRTAEKIVARLLP